MQIISPFNIPLSQTLNSRRFVPRRRHSTESPSGSCPNHPTSLLPPPPPLRSIHRAPASSHRDPPHSKKYPLSLHLTPQLHLQSPLDASAPPAASPRPLASSLVHVQESSHARAHPPARPQPRASSSAPPRPRWGSTPSATGATSPDERPGARHGRPPWNWSSATPSSSNYSISSHRTRLLLRHRAAAASTHGATGHHLWPDPVVPDVGARPNLPRIPSGLASASSRQTSGRRLRRQRQRAPPPLPLLHLNRVPVTSSASPARPSSSPCRLLPWPLFPCFQRERNTVAQNACASQPLHLTLTTSPRLSQSHQAKPSRARLGLLC